MIRSDYGFSPFQAKTGASMDCAVLAMRPPAPRTLQVRAPALPEEGICIPVTVSGPKQGISQMEGPHVR